MLLSCIHLAYVPDPLNNLNHLMIAAFMVAFFGSFQDVATDGMAVDIIPAEQQAQANGYMWGSKICGMSISLAVGSWLLSENSYTTAMLMLAVVIGVIMLVPLLFREREGEKFTPWTRGNASPETKKLQLHDWRQIFRALYRVCSLRNSILVALVLFISQGGFKYMATLLPIFTVKELGWTNLDYSESYSTAKLVGGIAGMLLGGFLMEKFGKLRMLNTYFLAVIFFIAILSFSTTY